MTIRKRTCENCGNILGLNDMAICEFTDRRIFTSPPCKLKHWLGKKYDRTQKKKADRFELRIAEHEAVTI